MDAKDKLDVMDEIYGRHSRAGEILWRKRKKGEKGAKGEKGGLNGRYGRNGRNGRSMKMKNQWLKINSVFSVPSVAKK